MRDNSCVHRPSASAPAIFNIFLALMVAGLTSAGAVIGATATGKAAAASTRSSVRKPAHAAHTPAVARHGRAGMVVGIDPASGELGPPTAEQLRTIQAASDPSLDHSTQGLQVISLPDGSQRVNLEGRFRAYSVVTIGPDGLAHLDCVEDRASALALAHAGSIAPRPAHVSRVVVGPREE
jgi:hypothetical protein